MPASEPHGDPTYRLSNWHHLRSPYGPLFTLLTRALVPLGVNASFWVFKLLVGAASLAVLRLVWACSRRLGRDGTAAIALVGLNPVVLIWGTGADHNDALMMVFLVFAIFCGLSGRAHPAWDRAAAALVVGIFIKAPAAIVAPVLLAVGDRRRVLAGAGLTAVVLAGVSFAAFGPHLPDLGTQSRLVTAIGIPNLIGLALGQGGETNTLQIVVGAVAGLVVLGCATWAARRPSDWLTAAGTAMLALVLSLSWSAPWYVLWILPFAALSGSRRLRITCGLLGVYAVLAFMPAAELLAHGVGFRPDRTPLGVDHTRAVNAVFR